MIAQYRSSGKNSSLVSHYHFLLFDSQAGKPLRGITSNNEEESIKKIVSYLKTEMTAQSLKIEQLEQQMMYCHRKLVPIDKEDKDKDTTKELVKLLQARMDNLTSAIDTHDAMIDKEMEMITDLNSTATNLENRIGNLEMALNPPPTPPPTVSLSCHFFVARPKFCKDRR